MRTVTAVEPVKVALTDGQERRFLLTRGGMTRIKQKLEIQSDRDLLNLPAEKIMVPLLLESEMSPKTLTAENIEDLLPIDIEWTARLTLAILGASLPDPQKPEPSPAIQ